MVEDLELFGAQWLLEHDFGEIEWVVEGLLPPGLSMIVSPPKFGKSYLMLNLGLRVVAGEPFWGLETHQSPVLYLALEDTCNRIHTRLNELTERTRDDFTVSIRSEGIGGGLIEQLERYLVKFPDAKLIMLDTLQRVRGTIFDNAYAADYADLVKLKEFADDHAIALMIVHHTRKARDPDDPFANISGTNGLMGACDTVFVLDKDKRSDKYATLSVTGRDVEFQEIRLLFNDGEWEFVERIDDDGLEEREVPECVLAAIDFMADRGSDWTGTASELIEQAGLKNVRSSVLGKHLSSFRQFLLDSGVKYRRERTGAARTLHLEILNNDGNDGMTG